MSLAEQIQSLAGRASAEQKSTWAQCAERLQEVIELLATDGTSPPSEGSFRPTPKWQLVQFGKLVRDKRNAAGLSRVELARLAKMSDATIKFLETARHPPSRATLLRLIGVPELKLSWTDVPGRQVSPDSEAGSAQPPDGPWRQTASPCNCFITPGHDVLAMLADSKRFLNGAGGHVEQTCAYLEHDSAAAFVELCQNSAHTASLRAKMPLLQMARQIVGAGAADLQVIALGAGDGVVETRLAGHLMEAHARTVDLFLLDISQPLLSRAYRHAADTLARLQRVHVWAVQGNFHRLPLYVESFAPPARSRSRRLFCMLGGTFANLDQELQFLRHSLLTCVADDLLLLDVPLVSGGPYDTPAALRQRDKLVADEFPPQYAAWLGGPIWRHCHEVTGVEFSWELETRCAVPRSYARIATATVATAGRADRRFSLFRFSRYDPVPLAECLLEIGWEEIGALPYAGDHSLRLYRRRAEPAAGSPRPNR